jgi:hypothetical protein
VQGIYAQSMGNPPTMFTSLSQPVNTFSYLVMYFSQLEINVLTSGIISDSNQLDHRKLVNSVIPGNKMADGEEAVEGTKVDPMGDNEKAMKDVAVFDEAVEGPNVEPMGDNEGAMNEVAVSAGAVKGTKVEPIGDNKAAMNEAAVSGDAVEVTVVEPMGGNKGAMNKASVSAEAVEDTKVEHMVENKWGAIDDAVNDMEVEAMGAKKAAVSDDSAEKFLTKNRSLRVRRNGKVLHMSDK